MAQLNPNFEIDFSDINSYEQIQLINDTQIARENLLMHRAYREPYDDEVIRNKFSSFTFVDFCPKVFTQQQSSGPSSSSSASRRRTPSASTLSLAKLKLSGGLGASSDSSVDLRRPHYELESFPDLFERINVWLKLNKDWQVVSMETLMFDCSSQFNHLRSSINSNYLPRNTRGLRLYLCPSKSRHSGAQKIGCINVVPRKVSGSHIPSDNQPAEYESLDQILHRLNEEVLLKRRIEGLGRILSVETITLPMIDGYANVDANYFVDNRLNMISQYVYLGAPSSGESSSLMASQQGHGLIDILRVYYEFGPSACGLVNIIDFVPKFYSPTTILDHLASTSEQGAPAASKSPMSSRPNSPEVGQHPDEESGDPTKPPVAQSSATEALTRLIRRSLAWFEAERKLMLNPSGNEAKQEADAEGQQNQDCPPIEVKLCNLRIQHKTVLKSQLAGLNSGTKSVDQVIDTRQMVHTRHTVSKSMAASFPTDVEQPKPSIGDTLNDLKFVRLAYVIPTLGTSKHRGQRKGPKAKVSEAPSRKTSLRSRLDTKSEAGTATPATTTPELSRRNERAGVESSASSTSSRSSTSGSPEPSSASSSSSSMSDSTPDLAGADMAATANLDEDEKQRHEHEMYLRILEQTNWRHRIYELEHQTGQPNELDDKLDDSPIGQLTYRLFAPCQLVQSSSCFAINPVNSSSPLSRRGSVGINGGGSGGLSSDSASASLLGTTGGGGSSLARTLGLDSFGAIFPSILNSDLTSSGGGYGLSGASMSSGFGPIAEQVSGSPPSGADASVDSVTPSVQPPSTSGGGGSSKFATNEFEPVDAIRRRMQVYVTTNSMKVLAGETHIVNLRSNLSCLSTAIEQTLVSSTSVAQSRSSTWVSVYVVYAAVDEPQVPEQLMATNQAKMRELSLAQSTTEAGENTATASGGDHEQQEPPAELVSASYKCAYDRTVALLPSEPENHTSCISPSDFMHQDDPANDCYPGCPARRRHPETFGPETRGSRGHNKHKRHKHKVRNVD